MNYKRYLTCLSWYVVAYFLLIMILLYKNCLRETSNRSRSRIHRGKSQNSWRLSKGNWKTYQGGHQKKSKKNFEKKI